MTNEDPIVAEVRKHRQEWAAKFNYDIHAIAEDACSRQGADGRQVVYPPKRKAKELGKTSGKAPTG